MHTGKPYYTYILRCADETLYTGYTDDLEKRLAAHNAGKGAKYTRGRRPVALAFAVRRPTKGEAQSLEAKIKQLSREEKLRLVTGWSGVPEDTAIFPPE